MNEILAGHCRQVQEAASMFAEITYLIQMESFASANQYIQRLRENNREYYNYLKPLLPLLEFLEENENSTNGCKFPIVEMFGLIKYIVLFSLDVDLTQLEPNTFRQKKELDRRIAGKLCPNRIFHDTVRKVCVILNQDVAPEVIRKICRIF